MGTGNTIVMMMTTGAGTITATTIVMRCAAGITIMIATIIRRLDRRSAISFRPDWKGNCGCAGPFHRGWQEDDAVWLSSIACRLRRRACAHVVIGGHVVLMNRSTYVVMDIIHLEL